MARQTHEPTVVVRGDVAAEDVPYAREKAGHVVASTTVPVLDVEIRLDHHRDPARERAHHVEMSIDLDGRPVRAHDSAPTMREAIDGTYARLRRRVEAATERAQSLEFRHRDRTAWHHDDQPRERPSFYPRPADERRLVRHKTFALDPGSIEEALVDLEVLDHDFYLFRHDETGSETVVYRVDRGYGIMQRVGTPDAIARIEPALRVGPRPSIEKLDTARTILDETEAPFVFFVDADTDRGSVLYRRYDGDYGVITAT